MVVLLVTIQLNVNTVLNKYMPNLKKPTFEQYLQDIHIKDYPEILDDDLPDRFNDWLVEEPIDNIIEYAKRWGELITKK